MGQRVVEVQSSKHQQKCLSHGQAEVDLPQDEGSVANPGLQHFGRGSRDLQSVEEAGTGTELRQQGNKKNHDAHAAEPLAETAPEKNAPAVRFDDRHHRGAGGRETGGRLEQGVDRIEECAGQDVGQGAQD